MVHFPLEVAKLSAVKTSEKVEENRTYQISFTPKQDYQGKEIAIGSKQQCYDKLQERIQAAIDDTKQSAVNEKIKEIKGIVYFLAFMNSFSIFYLFKEIAGEIRDENESLKTEIANQNETILQLSNSLESVKQKDSSLRLENKRIRQLVAAYPAVQVRKSFFAELTRLNTLIKKKIFLYFKPNDSLSPVSNAASSQQVASTPSDLDGSPDNAFSDEAGSPSVTQKPPKADEPNCSCHTIEIS